MFKAAKNFVSNVFSPIKEALTPMKKQEESKKLEKTVSHPYEGACFPGDPP